MKEVVVIQQMKLYFLNYTFLEQVTINKKYPEPITTGSLTGCLRGDGRKHVEGTEKYLASVIECQVSK